MFPGTWTIRHFDVGIIPYILDNYTASAYPGKLNEYLALGKPVVATPLPELQDFNDEYNHVIFLAADTSLFADALRRGLTDVTDNMREEYRKVARLNSWASRVEGMSHLIENAVAEDIKPDGLDILVRKNLETGLRDLPVNLVVSHQGDHDVRHQEVTAADQHPLGLGQEYIDVRVAVQAFDVHHDVERLIAERKPFRIALLKPQVGDVAVPSAKSIMASKPSDR